MDINVFDGIVVDELLFYAVEQALLADDLYVARAELRTDPYAIPIEEVDDKYLGILQAITKNIIDDKCKQNFSQEGTVLEPVERRHNGTGKFIQFLGKRLISLDKVRIYTSNGIYTEYTADNFNVEPYFLEWNIYSQAQSDIRASFQTDVFSKGRNNIGIFGVWGWAEYPEVIKYLQGKMISKLLKEGSLAQKFQSEEAGDYTYTVKKQDWEILGDPELDLIIRQYTKWSMYVI